MFSRILIVCVGNICRSPTAEILLRHRLGHAAGSVQSAGLAARAGTPMDATAQAVLADHGHDGSAHRARPLDDAMLREADLVLAMEPAHVDAIVERAPHARGRVMLLGRWQDERSIPDPFRQQRPAHEHVYALIDECVDAWLPYLRVS